MKILNTILLIFYAVSLFAEQNKTEIWNEGVDSYHNGDVTNTLQIMKPLMLDDTYSARSSEVVAKLEFERGNYEESARAAQVALRKFPNDSTRRENFNLAASKIPAVLQQKRLKESQMLFESKNPSRILYGALADAREIMAKSITINTNSAERAIALADDLSDKADKIALICPGLKNVLQNAVTNQEQMLTLSLQIDNLEKNALQASKMLSDMDEGAYSCIASSEMDLNKFFKLSVLPPEAIDEGIVCQSNQFMNVGEINSRSWQVESLDYTRFFRAKFAAWAKAYEEQASANTNMPPFTAEAQKEIVSLSHELEKLQLSCVEKDLPDEMLAALRIMFRIRDLLPKNGNSGNSSQGSSGDNENKSDNSRKSNENQDDSDKSDNRINNAESEAEQDQSEENKKEQDGSKEDESSKEDEEIEAVLNRAKERNDEYESEKKLRMRKAPLPPNQRDW